jgi:hypothetical protein
VRPDTSETMVDLEKIRRFQDDDASVEHVWCGIFRAA